MRAFRKKITDKKTLQELVPLNALSEKRFAEIMDKIVVEEIRSGGYLFRKGDRDNQSIYLLDGKVNLIDGRRKVTGEIEGGTDFSRYPVANQQPRTLSARAVSRVLVARIDSSLLDAFLTWDQTTGAEVTEINSDSNQDWMTRMLQSEAFERIPPAGIQRLLMKMQALPVQAGEVIVRQGDEGDFFYTIHTGRCIITRQAPDGGKDEVLAELAKGDCFGEEALVSDNTRNATITMLTDGMLMRLAKRDFVELLQKPLVRYVSYETAINMVNAGAVWIDVRSEGEYEEGGIEDSVNIPLSALRSEIPELVFNSQYIICCDTGSRSVSAAFVLSHKGFDVYVLEGGLRGLLPDERAQAGLPVQDPAAGPGTTAGVVAQETGVVSFDRYKTFADGGSEPAADALPDRENEALNLRLDVQEQTDGNSFRQQLQLQSAEEEKQLLRDQQAALRRDYQERIDQLQFELREARERVDALQAETGKTVQEKHRLQALVEAEKKSWKLQVEHLEGESIQYAQHAEALQADLREANDKISQMQTDAAAQHLEQQERLEGLRAELAQSRRDSGELQDRIAGLEQDKQCTVQDKDSELLAQRAELQGLQDELQALREQLNHARAESEASSSEQQRQAEELRGELERSQQHARALAEELESLQHEKQSAEQDKDNELSTQRAELEALHAQSEQSAREMETLQVRLQEVQEQLDQSRHESESQGQAHQEQVRGLEAELDQSEQQYQVLQQEMESLREERQAAGEQLDARLQQHTAELEQFGQQLEQSQQQKGELDGQLTDARSRIDELQQQLEEQAARGATELEEMQARNRELTQALEDSQADSQTLASQVEDLQRSHQEIQQQLEASQAEAAAGQQLLEQLQQEIGALEDDNQQLLAQRDETRGHAGELEADNRELHERLQALQQELDSESESHAEQHSAYEQQLVDLTARLETEQQAAAAEKERLDSELQAAAAEKERLDRELQAAATEKERLDGELQAAATEKQRLDVELQATATEKERLDSELQAYRAESEGRIEQQQRRHQEVKQVCDHLEGELETLAAERGVLQQKLSETEQELAAGQQETARLNGDLAALRDAAENDTRALDDHLAEERERASRSEREVAEQAAQIEALQQELEQSQQSVTELLQQMEAEKQDSEEGRQAIQQHAAQLQLVEQEHQQALQQLHAELDEKNGFERDMQGQIERLGKKLEQSAEEFQRLQDEAGENDERLRSELADERRARSEERADMAARQKELKQQLAEVAGKHEGVLASQAAAMEQARAEARSEERAQLGQQMEQGGQSGEQVEALQAELEALREQINVAVEQERERGAAELAVAREQRAESKAEIVGLRNELKQLAEARDEALNARQALEQQIKSLRKDNAPADDLVGAAEDLADADSSRLREELDDARMNIEIAVRLRTETEAELARVTEHRDKLLQQLDAAGPAEGVLAAVAPVDKGAGVVTGQHDDSPQGHKRRWLGAGVGLGVTGLAGLVFWLMLSVENPMTRFLDLVNMDKARSAWSEIRLPQWLNFIPGQEQATDTKGGEAAPDAAPGSQSDQPAPQASGKPAQAPAPGFPRARRAFRDTLTSGGRGPLMQALAADSYLMGSAGNSLIFEERPQHRVELAAFSISKYEVTFAEYDRFARATGRRLPHAEKWGRGDRPVINVTWQDARAYTRWLSKQTGHEYRLPTEAQWEYAARSGTTGDHWWDTSSDTTMANCFDCGSEWDGNSSAPVGSFPANSLGLHDTAGNVQEWTEDCYHPSYRGAAADGSARQRSGCTQRVVRGGSYSSPTDSLRSNKRGNYDQDTRIDNLGFRVVRVN